MVRVVVCAVVCLTLSGCVTNTLSTQNAQVVPIGGGAAPARAQQPQAAPPRPTMTPAARLATARSITVNKQTTAGARLILGSLQSLARDCSPLGVVEAKLLTPPANGTVRIEQGTAFSNFSAGDPPYACNSRRSPATVVSYQASPGFTGQDAAVVQIFFPDGNAPTMVFSIGVR